jgi:hypothetical protein
VIADLCPFTDKYVVKAYVIVNFTPHLISE